MSKLIKTTDGLFKHNHEFTGYAGDVPYLSYIGSGVIDGIGRQHITLYATCDICNQKIRVAMIHVDKDSKLYNSKQT